MDKRELSMETGSNVKEVKSMQIVDEVRIRDIVHYTSFYNLFMSEEILEKTGWWFKEHYLWSIKQV